MNADDAIKDHVSLKTRLRVYIAKPDGSLTPAVVATDDACDLGKWLHHEGRAFAGTGEYQALLTGHAKLHEAAAEIVTRTNHGEKLTEDSAFGPRSAFAVLLSGLVAQIMALKTKIRPIAQGAPKT